MAPKKRQDDARVDPKNIITSARRGAPARSAPDPPLPTSIPAESSRSHIPVSTTRVNKGSSRKTTTKTSKKAPTPPPRPPSPSESSSSEDSSTADKDRNRNQRPTSPPPRSHHFSQEDSRFPHRQHLPRRPKARCAADYRFWANTTSPAYDFLLVSELEVDKKGKLIHARFDCSLCFETKKFHKGWNCYRSTQRTSGNYITHFKKHHKEDWASWMEVEDGTVGTDELNLEAESGEVSTV